MKRIHDSTRLAELFVKAGLIAAIAATLLLPASINAHGAEAAPAGKHQATLPDQRWQALPLPPIPHLTATPWLTLERAPKGPKIDTLVPTPANLDPVLAITGLPLWAGMKRATADING